MVALPTLPYRHIEPQVDPRIGKHPDVLELRIKTARVGLRYIQEHAAGAPMVKAHLSLHPPENPNGEPCRRIQLPLPREVAIARVRHPIASPPPL